MTCFDEFAVEAYEGWRKMTAVVEELRLEHGMIGDGEERALKRWLRDSRSHLEGEFMSEVEESSHVPQHCARFALSHPTKKCFAAKCDHEHTGECEDCDQLDGLMEHLISLTDRLADEADSSDSPNRHRIRRLNEIVEFSCNRIRAYQAYILRAAVSNDGRSKIQDNFQEGDAIATLDFSMKIEPGKAIEGQGGFYGKKGITLHMAHILAKINGKLVYHQFAHTLDNVTQRPSDRGTSHFKRKMGEWKCEGNNIECAKDIFDALTGLSVHYCTFTEKKQKFDNNFPGITQLFSFEFEDSGVRTHGIGEGQVVQKEKLPQIDCVLDVVNSGGHLDESFWVPLGSSEKEKETVEEDDLEEFDDVSHIIKDHKFYLAFTGSFHCSTYGCKKVFLSTRRLIEHEVKGDHDIREKKKTITDHAVEKFNELIETRDTARLAVTEQVDAARDAEPAYNHKKGWALKSSHPTPGLDDTARELAVEYFNSQRSHNPPRRAEAPFMRKQLEEWKDPTDPTARRYLLNYSYIPSETKLTSLFSRLEKARVTDPSSTTKAKAPKIPRTTKRVSKANKKNTRAKSSVRSTSDGTRKRRVVRESDEEDMDDDVFENEGQEEEDGEDDEEIEREDEENFMKRIIMDEKDDIFEK